MQRPFSLFARVALLLVVPVLLSGCAGRDTTDISSQEQYPLQDLDSTVPEETALEDAESNRAIAEEVDALARSGVWGAGRSKDPGDGQSTAEEEKPLYNFPVEMNNQVRTYIRLFQGSQRRDFARKLARSGRYVEMMEKELAASGLPTDLAWLAMVESGFNPIARSSANAVGLWQFMAPTGRMYNLKINRWVDERRSIKKSTRAAVNYLGDLYREFGDWKLAVAAYNAGPGKIHRGLDRYGLTDFWELAAKNHLKMETKRYVPKLMATIIVARNPEKYGFGKVEKDKPLAWETITVGPSMKFDALALISESNIKTIRQLNPELRRQITPPTAARSTVHIPVGTGKRAAANLKRLHRIASTAYKSHRIAQGESIADICRRYNINATTLLKVNHLSSERLIPGKRLRIPYSTITWKLLPKGSSNAMLAFKESLILHKIKRGDTISAIARKYRVPGSLIIQWNGLKNAHSIRAGQQLALFIDKAGRADLSGLKKTGSVTGGPVTIAAVRVKKYHPAKNSRSETAVPSIAAVKKKIRHSEVAASAAGTDSGWYSVRSGDSLWAICRKFNISIAELKRINGLKTNELKPGSRLQVRR